MNWGRKNHPKGKQQHPMVWSPGLNACKCVTAHSCYPAFPSRRDSNCEPQQTLHSARCFGQEFVTVVKGAHCSTCSWEVPAPQEQEGHQVLNKAPQHCLLHNRQDGHRRKRLLAGYSFPTTGLRPSYTSSFNSVLFILGRRDCLTNVRLAERKLSQ